nr:hypothetical protein RTCK_02233 [Rhizobium sp. TCK]
MKKRSYAILLVLGVTITGSGAQAKDLANDDLKALLSAGKTLQLGGEGTGYSGTLAVSSDGTAKGLAKTDAGQEIVINGTWRIEDNRFCRTWETLDQGREVCERWELVGTDKVEVYNGDEMIGVNSW